MCKNYQQANFNSKSTGLAKNLAIDKLLLEMNDLCMTFK
jgi:hypothetical protein